MFSKPWQPLTPKGAAAFAAASFTRLYVVLLCFALATGFSVMFFLSRMCVPVVDSISEGMPEGAVLSLGEMFGLKEPVGASTPFLSVDVDISAELPDTHASDVRVLFHRTGWKACSLLGCLEQSYPRDATLALGPSHLGPKWAAWKPLVLVGAALATVLWLISIWTVLATVYCLPLWLVAVIAGRRLGPIGSWKVAAAGMMPGCAMMIVAVVLYALRVVDLPALTFITAAHFVAGWIFLAVVVSTVERKEAKAKSGANPFGGSPPSESENRPPPRKTNPFAGE